jgi:hypothetical protein
VFLEELRKQVQKRKGRGKEERIKDKSYLVDAIHATTPTRPRGKILGLRRRSRGRTIHDDLASERVQSSPTCRSSFWPPEFNNEGRSKGSGTFIKGKFPIEAAISYTFKLYIYFVATLNCYEAVFIVLIMSVANKYLRGVQTTGANQMLAFSQQPVQDCSPEAALIPTET